jgi:tetratricopeptide (TPR) repeat protein
VRGDSAGAIADLERAVAAGKAAKQPAESIAWAEWQLGNDYFTLGQLAKAEAFYRQSLATYPNYYRALAGMAQVRAWQKRYDEAIDLYCKAVAILPMPDYIAALGDIYSKVGKSDETRNSMSSGNTSGKSMHSTRPFTTGNWPTSMPIMTSSPRKAWN